jgi:hypothetical protein
VKVVVSDAVLVTSAAGSGDVLAALMALRDWLALELDACRRPRDIAVLSARLTDVLARIDAAERSRGGQPRSAAADDDVRAELARKRCEFSGFHARGAR